jgi:ferredoxin
MAMPSYRIVVDRERCVGDGLCRERADGTFDIDKELRCAVRDAKGNSPEDILFAAWGCANGCIALYNEATGERVWPGGLSREAFDELARRKREEMSSEEWEFWRDLGGGD